MANGIPFGNFFFLGRLNTGGMAEVFLGKGYDRKYANKLLAIKRMRKGLSDDHDFVNMFKDEAAIASRLSHNNICQLYEQGELAGQLFLVMEFIHGKDLRTLRQRAKERGELIPPRIAGLIVARIACALDYAHSLSSEAGEPYGIVHRDISPQNIVLSYDGIPKLIDFGIAKAKNRIAKTRVGILKGKFAYMAPEQATSQEVDSRTDLFALGVVLYELLTHEMPFKGATDFSTIEHITKCEYRPPLEINPDIPHRLDAVIKKTLVRDPADRYQTGQQMAADIENLLAEDARPANETTLSAFMRKLFREDYIREMAHIRDYLAAELPARPAAPPAKLAATTTVESVLLDSGPTPAALGADEDTTQAAKADIDAKPRAEDDAAPSAEAEAVAEAVAKAEAEIEAIAKADAEARAKAKAKAAAVAETGTDVEIDVNADADTDVRGNADAVILGEIAPPAAVPDEGTEPLGGPSTSIPSFEDVLAEADDVVKQGEPSPGSTEFESLATREISSAEIAQALAADVFPGGGATQGPAAVEIDPSTISVDSVAQHPVTTEQAFDVGDLAHTTEESALPDFNPTLEQTFAPMIAEAARAQKQPKRGGMTRSEIMILVIAALLGTSVVAATRWILSSPW